MKLYWIRSPILYNSVKKMMLYELKKFEVILDIYVRKVNQLDDEFSSMFKAMGYSDPTDLSIF